MKSSKTHRLRALRRRLLPRASTLGILQKKTKRNSTLQASIGTSTGASTSAIAMHELRDELQALVEINSPSQDSAGVNRVQREIAKRLEKMGFIVTWRYNQKALSGDLLVAHYQGKRSEYVTFVGHADTVLGNFSPDHFRVSADGLRAVGSGVIDNKGGLIIALRGLESFLQQHQPEFSLRFVSSPNEELGSLGWHDIYREFALDSWLVLGFEPALENGSVVHSRRGNRWYDVAVKGYSAHAGRSQGEHVNAAFELAIKLAKLAKLTDYRKEVAVNAGYVQGGVDKFNVICGEAHAKIDARYSTFQSRDRLHRQIVKILNKKYLRSVSGKLHAETTFTLADDCPPFASSLRSRGLVKKLTSIISRIEGHPVLAEKAGGAGDVNYMSDRHLVVIDGLGAVGGGMHTTEEFIFLPSLVTRSQALTEFLCLAERQF